MDTNIPLTDRFRNLRCAVGEREVYHHFQASKQYYIRAIGEIMLVISLTCFIGYNVGFLFTTPENGDWYTFFHHRQHVIVASIVIWGTILFSIFLKSRVHYSFYAQMRQKYRNLYFQLLEENFETERALEGWERKFRAIQSKDWTVRPNKKLWSTDIK